MPDDLTPQWVVDRAIELMTRTKANLVSLYAEPYGGYTEPINIVRLWSKPNIVRAILLIEYPDESPEGTRMGE